MAYPEAVRHFESTRLFWCSVRRRRRRRRLLCETLANLLDDLLFINPGESLAVTCLLSCDLCCGDFQSGFFATHFWT